MCLVHTCFCCKSFSKLSWDTGPAPGTQDVLWYHGIVAPVILVGECSLLRDLSSYPKLEVCLSSRRAEILVSPALTNLEVCLSTRRAEVLVPLSLLEAGRVSALAVLKWFRASSSEAGHISEEELSEGSCEADKL